MLAHAELTASKRGVEESPDVCRSGPRAVLGGGPGAGAFVDAAGPVAGRCDGRFGLLGALRGEATPGR